MKLRKILSVVLCVAAMASVMTVVALHAQAAGDASAALAAAAAPSTESTTRAPTTTTLGYIDQLGDWWKGFYPSFDSGYKTAFNGLAQILVLGFQFLLKLVGLNQWTGGLLNIF